MNPTNTKAYQIFVSEVGKHLQSAGAVLKNTENPSPEEVYRAGASFHTIKGGAGFFGLDEIAKTAGRLEDMLHSAGLDMEQQINTIKDLLHELEELAVSLPKPTDE